MSLVNYIIAGVRNCLGRFCPKLHAKSQQPAAQPVDTKIKHYRVFRFLCNRSPQGGSQESRCGIIKGNWAQKPAERRRSRKEACKLSTLIVIILPLVILLLSCQASNLNWQGQWRTYRNPRYDFEFPYPSTWVSLPMPDNRDGRAFRDPLNPSAEIRGWAAKQLSNSALKPSAPSQPQNFTTEQGVRGQLQVDVGSTISSMTLTLNQQRVQYSWQGQCNSEQFADYYRLFYYIASQYRV